MDERNSLMKTIAVLLGCSVLAAAPLPTPAQGPAVQIRKPVITFVELGSVKCIPCRQMQPVMKAIEEKYSGQVEVIFHDVWKEDQRHYAKQYGIRVIPTQVFLDHNGRELMRHEGFFPEKEIDAFLQGQGLKP